MWICSWNRIKNWYRTTVKYEFLDFTGQSQPPIEHVYKLSQIGNSLINQSSFLEKAPNAQLNFSSLYEIEFTSVVYSSGFHMALTSCLTPMLAYWTLYKFHWL